MNRRNFLQGLLAAGAVTFVQPITPVRTVPFVAAIDTALFEEIAKITLDRYRYVLAESILTSRPTYFWLKQSGDFEVIPSESIFEPLIREQ